MVDLSHIFDRSISKRDKFLARLLGLFSEGIVRIWTRESACIYEDLGRPTVTQLDTGKRFTLDFTLSLKSPNLSGRPEQPEKRFVTEMKCWTEYENYRFLNLAAEGQLERLNNANFKAFLTMPKHPENFVVKVSQQQIAYDGTMLIWARAEPDVIESVKQTYGLYEVLTLENIITDLIRWENQEYKQFLNERAAWCNHLFTELGNGS